MENKDVAAIFAEIANILEIQESNPFRIRSFRRAAQIIENLSFNVTGTIQKDPGKLRAIPGIGDGTLQKIEELVKTGTCEELEKLKQEIPSSLLPMLKLQNLGPKKISVFWKKLNISTLEELEKAALQQKIRTLPGMGEKSEAKILKAIKNYRQIQGRFQLDDGIEISTNLVNYLKSKIKTNRIAAAGSVRRRRETVGDIDILITCKNSSKAIQTFVQHPDVTQVLASGNTKASIVLRRGLQADLRVLEDNSFGAALQYFTGSKTHNVALRERAKRMGYKINEYGLFKIQDGVKIAGAEEKEIYHLLELSFIPPEMREGRGEIEQADKQELPLLIEQKDIKGDLHMHTKATDGQNSIVEMATAGTKFGYDYIAITDHSQALAMARGLNEERLLQQIEEIDKVSAKIPKIKILKGIEVDILSGGKLDLRDQVLSKLDIVIASVHSQFNLSKMEMTNRICRAMENQYVNILAHPTGRLLTRREPYLIEMEKIIDAALQNRVCLEINAHPSRLDLSDVHCRMAKEMGVLLSINSDSHNLQMLNYMQYGVFTARRGWLTPNDVINTYPFKKLCRVLGKKEYN